MPQVWLVALRYGSNCVCLLRVQAITTYSPRASAERVNLSHFCTTPASGAVVQVQRKWPTHYALTAERSRAFPLCHGVNGGNGGRELEVQHSVPSVPSVDSVDPV
jgi:hypothetical protein